jgi:low affinity Fe/Cu permease
MFDSSRMQTLPQKNNTLASFAIGAALLVVPLILILVWGSSACMQTFAPSYCISTKTFMTVSSFLPFVMLVGGVLIGYRMKKIADSLTPRDEPDEESHNDASFSE